MDGKTGVYGIIGNPIEHSMSPLMQNFYMERTGKNLAYVPFRVEKEQLGDALKGALALHICGMNVTVPHKQEVMKYLAELDEDAAAIGAVNTLVYTEKGYKGYNTDGAGFKRALLNAGIPIEGRDCILLGAGGAAKAVAYILAKEGAASIYVLNRSREKAEQLASYVNGLMGRPIMHPLALTELSAIPAKKKGYLAVQSTSVGMYPKTEEAVIESSDFYELIHTGVDVVYTPAHTRFMELVEQAGGRAINGLDMLLYQGIIAYELWNPDAEIDRETTDQARDMILEYLQRKQGKKLVLIGFMGAGKTTAAQAYAKAYGLPLIDTDVEIEKKAGMAIADIFKQQGEEAFRRIETQVLEELIEKKGAAVISVGGGLPMGVQNRPLLRQLGKVVYLDVSAETVLQRIGSDVSDRPMLCGCDVKERIGGLLTERRPVYQELSHVSVDVNGRTVSQIVEEIHDRMEE